MILHLPALHRPASQEYVKPLRPANHFGDGYNGDGDGNGSSPSDAEYAVGVSVVPPCISQLYLLAQILGDDP